ncbi:MAG: hypothetical protein AB8B91_15600 [Rubripirellula sp.]
MNRYLIGLLGLAASAWATSAQAQLVRVGAFGGVSVRAPFVRVNVLPFGMGTQVRAPFTSVNTRAYALGYSGYYGQVYHPPRYYAPAPVYRVPVYHVQPIPVYVTPVVRTQTIQSAPMNRVRYQTTRPAYTPGPSLSASMPGAGNFSSPAQLRQAAESLKRSLASRPDDADVWLEYLAPQKIIDALDGNESHESLRMLQANYEGVVGNPSLTSIRAASGFTATYQSLRQHVGQASPQANEDSATTVLSTSDDKTDEPTLAAPVKAATPDSTEEIEELAAPVPTPL